MSEETTPMRINAPINSDLKDLTEKLPEWSAVRLANTLLAEAIAAIASDAAPTQLPTIDYIRRKLGRPTGSSLTELMLERLERAAENFNAAKASPKKQQAARKNRAA